MATKKAAVSAPVVEEESVTFVPGSHVQFNGYSVDMPEDEKLLTEGEVYEIVDVKDDKQVLGVRIANPDFNPKQAVSDRNLEDIVVEVYFEEVTPVDDDDVDADADAVEEEAVEEEAPQRPAPRTNARTAPAKTTPVAKAAPAKTTTTAKAAPAKAAAPVAKAAPAKTTTAAKAAPAKAVRGGAAVKTAVAKSVSKAGAKAVAVKPPAELTGEARFIALDSEDESILSLVSGAENLLSLAQEVAQEATAAEWTLAGVLYHVRLTGEYKAVQPEYAEDGGFALYVQEQLGLQYRKAMYLLDIYYKFNKFGIGAEYLQNVGWTKCSVIASVMDEANAEDLVELAETSTVADLKDAIKVGYAKTSDGRAETAKKVTFKFRLFEDSATAVTEVLQRHAAALGTKNLDQVFEQIVMEWATEHGGAEAKAARRKTVATAKSTTPVRGAARASA